MFTKRSKRNYRIAVWTAVLICLCILILYFAWPQTPEEGTEVKQNPDYNPAAAANTDKNPDVLYDDEDEPEDSNKDDSDSTADSNMSENEDNSINDTQNPYYLVKRAGNEIAVFFCDARGNMVQLETTEILYEMLGPEDQLLFDQGIKIRSQEELSVLLQDFEG